VKFVNNMHAGVTHFVVIAFVMTTLVWLE